MSVVAIVVAMVVEKCKNFTVLHCKNLQSRSLKIHNDNCSNWCLVVLTVVANYKILSGYDDIDNKL